jgi:hypothetical protein
MEVELMVDARRSWREWYVTELLRHSRRISYRSSTDFELHHLVYVFVLVICANFSSILIVAHQNGLACIRREIDNDLVSLSKCRDDVLYLDRILKKTCIGRNDLEWKPRAGSRGLEEEQVKVAGNRSIEDAEVVLARLHIYERPGHSVDMDNVAPQTILFVEARIEGAVAVLVFGRLDKGNVELSVARWQTQGVLCRVSHQIRASLAKVCVLRSLSMC